MPDVNLSGITDEYTRAALHSVQQRLDALEGGGAGHDLGSYGSVEQLALSGGTVSLDPEIHTSWLQTTGAGPTALTLIAPLPFAIGFCKLIFCTDFSPGDDITLGHEAIKGVTGGNIVSIQFTAAAQWLLIEAWDTNLWRLIRASDGSIVTEES